MFSSSSTGTGFWPRLSSRAMTEFRLIKTRNRTNTIGLCGQASPSGDRLIHRTPVTLPWQSLRRHTGSDSSTRNSPATTNGRVCRTGCSARGALTNSSGSSEPTPDLLWLVAPPFLLGWTTSGDQEPTRSLERRVVCVTMRTILPDQRDHRTDLHRLRRGFMGCGRSGKVFTGCFIVEALVFVSALFPT